MNTPYHKYWYLIRDEVIKYETDGYLDGTRYTIICTHKRIIFVSDRFLRGLVTRTLNIGSIESIETRKPFFLYGSIIIDFGTYRMKISSLLKRDIEGLEMAINNAIINKKMDD